MVGPPLLRERVLQTLKAQGLVNDAPVKAAQKAWRRFFSANVVSHIGLFSLSLGLVLALAAVTVFA